jgi:hypothetical protein
MVLLHKVEFQWFIIRYPDSLAVMEEVISFIAFGQGNVATLFDTFI